MTIALEILNNLIKVAQSGISDRHKRASVAEEINRFSANAPNVTARRQLREMLMRAADDPDAQSGEHDVFLYACACLGEAEALSAKREAPAERGLGKSA